MTVCITLVVFQTSFPQFQITFQLLPKSLLLNGVAIRMLPTTAQTRFVRVVSKNKTRLAAFSSGKIRSVD